MNRTIKQINKKIISLFLVVIVLFSVIPTVLFSAFAEEFDKTKFIMPIESFDASAVRINTPEDLIAIANNMYGSYVLANDIDMSGYNWTPIGKSLSSPFYGKLDGQGHKIINLNINISINSASLNSPAHAVGLFGVCSGAVIKNIDFENASVSVSNSSGYEYTNVKIEGRNIYAGVVCGYAENATVVYNCCVSGNVSATSTGEAEDAFSGSIVGAVKSAVVSATYSDCTTKSSTQNQMYDCSAFAGGLVGSVIGPCDIDRCYNVGSVSATTLDFGIAYSGGLVGFSSSSQGLFNVTDSFNEAAITARAGNLFSSDAIAGGIVGKLSGSIQRTYNSGAVTSATSSVIGEGNAYAGGIAGNATSNSVIESSFILNSTVAASSEASRYQYRISYGGEKYNNGSVSTYTSGSTIDADYMYSRDTYTGEDVFSSTGWNFGSVWEFIADKDFPQLRHVDTQDEEYSENFIEQHANFISGQAYSDFKNYKRWAQIYWSDEIANYYRASDAHYKMAEYAADIINFRFPDIFENLYEIMVADYVANQGITDNIEELSKINIPLCGEKIYKKGKSFIESHWESGWGELSDEDLFWLFHYEDRPSEEWINSNFEDHISEIVYDTRHSADFLTSVFGFTTGAVDTAILAKDGYNKVVNWINACNKFSVQIDSFMQSTEEFKKFLQIIYDNLPDDSLKGKLRSALGRYTGFIGDTKEEIYYELWADFVLDETIDSVIKKGKKILTKKTKEWLLKDISAAASTELKLLGWTADSIFKIADLIANNGDLAEFRELLKYNCYFEKATFNALEIVESQFMSDQNYDNAKLFDEAFKFVKETEIYSMDIYAQYLDKYQTAWTTKIANGLSSSSMSSEIESVMVDKLDLYNLLCHGTQYDLGGKIVTVACPTDVYIYDEQNNLVASIEDNLMTMKSAGIASFVSTNIKIFALPLDQNYTVKVIATGNGNMNYYVSEYNSEMENIQTVVYSDIDISVGESFTSTVSKNSNETPEAYDLYDTNNESVASSEVITLETLIPVENVSIDKSHKKILLNDTYQVTAQVFPTDASNKSLVWVTGDSSIAQIDSNGNLLANAIGTTEVAAYSMFGGISDYFELTVVDPSVLTVMTTSLPNVELNKNYSYQLSAVGGENLTWSFDGSLPSGISISDDGIISGKTSSEGQYTLTVSVSDGINTATEELLLIVGSGKSSPIIITETIPTAKQGEYFEFKLSANGSPNISWKIKEGNLPAGIQLFESGLLKGIPQDSGTFYVTIVASNSSGKDDSKEFLFECKCPVVDEGITGNISWTVYSNGTLQLDGSGAISDYDEGSAPWYKYRKDIERIIIADEISAIGSYAFEGFSSLKNLVIPQTVSQISEYALYNCNALEELTVPFVGKTYSSNNTYDAVLGYIFGRCSTSENGISQYYKLADNSFSGYDYKIPSSLKTVNISNATQIPFGAFNGCNTISEININEGVSTINGYAFADCSGLTNIIIPDSVNNQSESIFDDCSSLQSITLPFIGSSRIANNSYDAVFGYIFGRCSNTEGVKQYYILKDNSYYSYNYAIPESLKEVIITDAGFIPFGAFHNCSNINEFKINDISHINGYAFANCIGIKDFIVPESVTGIDEYAFNGCTNISSISIPFLGSSRSANGTYDAVLGYIFGRSSSGVVQYGVVSGTSLSGYYYAIPSNLKSVTVTDASLIPIGAFSNCTNITYIKINEGISELSDYSLMECTGLKEIRLPSTLSVLSYDILYDCSSLEKVYIYSRNCNIDNYNETIPSGATIYAYSGSTAQSYANLLRRNFIPIDVAISSSVLRIDNNKKIIYGVSSSLKDVMSVITVSGEGTAETSPNSRAVTGTKIELKDISGSVTDCYYVVVFGDVNGDGVYDGTDAIIVNCIAKGLLSKAQVGEAVYMAADCNHDDVIDEDDVALLEQAGILLESVDQSKSEEELLETNSAYVEYLNLIDQTVEEDTTDTAGDEPTVPEIGPARPDPLIFRIVNAIALVFWSVVNFFTNLFD